MTNLIYDDELTIKIHEVVNVPYLNQKLSKSRVINPLDSRSQVKNQFIWVEISSNFKNQKLVRFFKINSFLTQMIQGQDTIQRFNG